MLSFDKDIPVSACETVPERKLFLGRFPFVCRPVP
jgi:hypothetical protein